MKKLAAAGLCCLAMGCAKRADQIAAAYVSPYQYENFTCPQLADEAQRIGARSAQAAGAQDEKAMRDALATGVALILFWPALLLIGGNDPQTHELARLRGEMEAIEQASIRKLCGIQFQQAPEPREPTKGPARSGRP